MANGSSRAGTRSLQVVLGEVQIERDAQLRHFDALDAKAGIILGFAGAIVALAPSHHLIVSVGRLVAVLSGLLALWTYWPRRFEITNLYALREKYLGAQPEFTKLVLLDTQISMVSTTRDILDRKASRLKAPYGFPCSCCCPGRGRNPTKLRLDMSEEKENTGFGDRGTTDRRAASLQSGS